MKKEFEKEIRDEIKSLKSDLKDIKPSKDRLQSRIEMTLKLKQELDNQVGKSGNDKIIMLNSTGSEKKIQTWLYLAAASVLIIGSFISYTIFYGEQREIKNDNQIVKKAQDVDTNNTLAKDNSDIIVIDTSSKIDSDTVFVQKSELEFVKQFHGGGFGFVSTNSTDKIIDELNSAIRTQLKFKKDKNDNLLSSWFYMKIDKNVHNKVRFVLKSHNGEYNLYLEKTNVFKNNTNAIIITDSIINILR